MNKYVVAFNGAWDTCITQQVVKANSATAAMWEVLEDRDMKALPQDYEDYQLDTIDGIDEFAFDRYEANISVIEV